jgi:hypothetical protein
MACIYITTNKVNGKKYIGQSKYNNLSYLGSGKLLKQAIKKYGKDNFCKKIIVKGHFNYALLNELEIHYIQLYNAVNNNNFYNLKRGGNNTGVKHKKEHITKLKNWKENPILKINKNKKLHNQIVKKANKASVLSTSKTVYEFNENYKVINIFNSTSSAASTYNLHSTNIAYACRNNSNKNKIIYKTGGRLFSYTNKILSIPKAEFIAKRNFKKVIMYNNSYNIIKIFNSVNECSRELSLGKESIKRHCKKENKTFNKNIMYEEDFKLLKQSIKKDN